MLEFIVTNETTLRLGAFLGLLMVMGLAEAVWPRRQRLVSRLRRWSTNLGLVVVNSILLRLAFPVVAVGMSQIAASRGWGVFNILEAPPWLEFLLAVVLLDMAIYGQHVIMHKVPVLWRLHRMHHCDPDFDTTTGIRFHPLEILLSMLIKLGLVVVIGPMAAAVIVFEILLNGGALFNHANLKLPGWLDRLLRWLIVTPDMHRIHHSVIRTETDSNYGFNLSVWDRLFGTYTETPDKGHIEMTVGLNEWPDRLQTSALPFLLKMPFMNRPRQTARD